MHAFAKGMVLACPNCGAEIPEADINIASDLAYCRRCSHAHSAASLATRQHIPHLHELHGAPRGVIFTRTLDGFRVSASHYSAGQCATALFLAVFWNTITGLFISINTMATLRLLGVRNLAGISLPVITGTGASLGQTLFLWLFLSPFIAIGLALIAALITTVFGRTELSVSAGAGKLFTGVGGLGLTTRFRATDIMDVSIERERRRSSNSGTPSNAIILRTSEGKAHKFGGNLSANKRTYMAAVLADNLLH